jgi:uncharacterized MAPEG superfamily protein
MNELPHRQACPAGGGLLKKLSSDQLCQAVLFAAGAFTEENMPLELQLLVWSIALAFILMMIAVSGAILQVGLPKLAGNREGFADCTGLPGRAQRAQRNMLENLILFAALVLVAQAAGRLNAMTALGAQLFFWARVAHAVIYIAGVPWLRTAAWGVSVAGLVLIFLQVL